MQFDRSIGPIGELTSQPRAKVSQCSEITFAGMVGLAMHPFSVIVSAPIFSEYAFPLGTWAAPSHCPSQGDGAFQEMGACLVGRL